MDLRFFCLHFSLKNSHPNAAKIRDSHGIHNPFVDAEPIKIFYTWPFSMATFVYHWVPEKMHHLSSRSSMIRPWHRDLWRFPFTGGTPSHHETMGFRF